MVKYIAASQIAKRPNASNVGGFCSKDAIPCGMSCEKKLTCQRQLPWNRPYLGYNLLRTTMLFRYFRQAF